MAAKTEKGLKQEIVNLFPVRLRQILEALPLDFARLEEIRLRCGQPILFRIAGKEMGITGSGDLTELYPFHAASSVCRNHAGSRFAGRGSHCWSAPDPR